MCFPGKNRTFQVDENVEGPMILGQVGNPALKDSCPALVVKYQVESTGESTQIFTLDGESKKVTLLNLNSIEQNIFLYFIV